MYLPSITWVSDDSLGFRCMPNLEIYSSTVLRIATSTPAEGAPLIS